MSVWELVGMSTFNKSDEKHEIYLMLFGKLPSCVKTRWQQPTSELTLWGLLSLQQQAAEKLSVPLMLPTTHLLSALSAPREGSRTTKTLPVADAMKILPRGWGCIKKRQCYKNLYVWVARLG